MKKLLVLFVAAVFLFAASHVQAAAKQIKVAHTSYPGTPNYRAWEDAKKFIDENSNGKYILDVNDSTKLGPTTSTMQGAQFGTIHMVEDGAPNFAGFDRAIGILDLPYLFPDYESVDAIMYGPIGQKILDHLSQKSGTKALAFGGNGFRGVFTNDPITNINEAKGKKIRSTPSQSHIAGLKALGFAPTPMPWPETIPGIQQRVINGFDVDLASALTMGLGEVAPNLFVSEHMYTPHIVVANEDWWQGMTEADRALFQKMIDIYVANSLKYAREDDITARKELSKKGHVLHPISPEDKAVWIKDSMNVYKELPEVPSDWVEEIHAKLKEMGKIQ